jgi:eukaryotic-like serine/threonine-protein kinase
MLASSLSLRVQLTFSAVAESVPLASAGAPVALVAGKYRVTDLLGRGGMGSVWAGVHTSLGTRVAVKFIDVEHATSREARQRFENEARAAASLRSKHVVEVYDHGVTDDGRPFIVMEYLDGEPLDRRLDRIGRMQPKDTARIAGQVCRALSKAHAVGIVHRDLKPENVFLVWDDEDGADVAKVVDFGIAKFTDSMSVSSSATRTGSVLGTPYYMSPEQARGLRSVDFRSDLWSVGVIVFRFMTGHLPFEGEAVGDVLVKLCTAPVPVPSHLVSDLPPGFDAWTARALAREPEGRFQSAADLAQSLAAVCGLTGPVMANVSGDSFSTVVMPSKIGPHVTPFSATTPSPALTPAPLHGTTGAPITQTPSPHAEKPRAGTIVVASLAALVVIGIGVAVLTKVLGEEPAPVAPASPADAASTQVAPAAQPAPTAPPVAPPVAPTADPSPEPRETAVATPSAAPKKPPAAKPTPRPAVKKPPPGAAAPKPGTDIGF